MWSLLETCIKWGTLKTLGWSTSSAWLSNMFGRFIFNLNMLYWSQFTEMWSHRGRAYPVQQFLIWYHPISCHLAYKVQHVHIQIWSGLLQSHLCFLYFLNRYTLLRKYRIYQYIRICFVQTRRTRWPTIDAYAKVLYRSFIYGRCTLLSDFIGLALDKLQTVSSTSTKQRNNLLQYDR